MTLVPKRRKGVRVYLETALNATIAGARSGSARVRDLALGGAFLETDQQPSVGSTLHVTILTGTPPFESDAVVRSVAPGGIGIEFVQMKPADRKSLRNLIAKLLE